MLFIVVVVHFYYWQRWIKY